MMIRLLIVFPSHLSHTFKPTLLFGSFSFLSSQGTCYLLPCRGTRLFIRFVYLVKAAADRGSGVVKSIDIPCPRTVRSDSRYISQPVSLQGTMYSSGSSMMFRTS